MSIARELSTRLAELLLHEHSAMADFLVALAAFDAKRHWETLGYDSLFWFLHRELGLSKSAAFYRKAAAELIGDFPEVLDALRDGRLCVSSVAELAKVRTRENAGEVLPRFFTLSKREAKEVAAELLPMNAPPLREVVTVVQAPTPALALSLSANSIPPSSGSPANLPHANSRVPDVAPAPAAPLAQPASFEVEPLTAELRRLHITVSKRLLEKLDAAADALSHSHPGATRDEIIEVGLDLINERHAKRRGLVKNPRERAPESTSESNPTAPAPRQAKSRRKDRYAPAHLRRAIWERDQGKCQWPIDGGGICGATCRAEVDHIELVAKGGRLTKPEDGRILCRFHQDVSARRVLGGRWMNRFTRRRGRSRP
jgi:hypothetical protein